MHLLVVEDDPRLVRLLRRLLEEDRHIVETATTGLDGFEIAEAAPGIEVVILDVGLPDISGLEVARRIRATGSEVAILMLTARDTIGDRVTGLDAGADDYLVKPFAYEELAARLRALGRRGAKVRRPEPKLVAGPIVLDETSRRVTLDGRSIDLSPARVLAARVPAPPPGPDPVARSAAGPGLAVQRGGDAKRGGRLRPLPAREARRGGAADRDRARRGLSSGRCLTRSRVRPRRPLRNWPPRTTDGRLIRHVRRNLVLWSGGTTLLILLALAVALYAAVAGSLASSGVSQLDARMGLIKGVRPDPADESRYGFVFGGGSSGTYALIIGPDGAVVTGPGARGPQPPGLPYAAAVTAAATSGRDVRTGTIASTPVRILTETVVVDGQTFTVQVVQDRTAEERTLEVMLAVLLPGGLVVVLVAFGFGAVYARRALVPIRESLASQRVALRRQREFAADASHELRTPLTVIRSSVDHLLRHPTEPVRRSARRSRTSTRRSGT